MNNITIDMEKAFDNIDIDKAHAIETIALFLKTIEETGMIDPDCVKIEKFAFVSDNQLPDENICNLELENLVCNTIESICDRIKFAVRKRSNHNSDLICALKLIKKESENIN